MTLPDIVDAVVKAAHPHDTNKIGLVISGGEPLLQLDEDMLTALSPLFDFIDIETNGTVRPKFDVLAWSMRTFISCSPKTGDIVLSVNDVDWYKLLVPAKEHLLPIIEERAALTDATIYLQPVEVGGPHSDISKHNLERTIALSLSTGHPVGLQLHKYIGVR
jgi:organic radical activating enzyme